MAETWPLKEIPKVDGTEGCSVVEFDNDDYIPGSIIENDGVTRAKLADLSVGREQIVLGQVWHSHLSSETATTDGAVAAENLVHGASFTEADDEVVVVGPNVTVRTPAGSFTTARSFNTVSLGTITGGGFTIAGDGLDSPSAGRVNIQNFDALQHTSVLISGQLSNDNPTVTNTPTGYSGPLQYSWEGGEGGSTSYVRIFSDDGSDERLYNSLDLDDANLVYTKTY